MPAFLVDLLIIFREDSTREDGELLFKKLKSYLEAKAGGLELKYEIAVYGANQRNIRFIASAGETPDDKSGSYGIPPSPPPVPPVEGGNYILISLKTQDYFSSFITDNFEDLKPALSDIAGGRNSTNMGFQTEGFQ